MKHLAITIFSAILAFSCQAQTKEQNSMNKAPENFPLEKSEQEWKAQLTPEEYFVLRQKGTERPYTGEYNVHFESGTYNCRGCEAPLFKSDSKFDSHCGWPRIRCYCRKARQNTRYDSYRNPLCKLWRTFRPCLQRWTYKNWSTLLREQPKHHF